MDGIDKLDALVGGRPLLHWTLAALRASRAIDSIVLVSTPDKLLVARTDRTWSAVVDWFVPGGATRQLSVAAGVRYLAQVDPDGRDRPVLVHDGARPLVTPALIEAVVDAVEAHGAAVPVVPIPETVKRVEHGMVAETVDRTALATAQTPQGARRALLLEAFDRFPPDGPDTFTDEAALPGGL